MAISRREIVSFTLCVCVWAPPRTQDGYDFFLCFALLCFAFLLCVPQTAIVVLFGWSVECVFGLRLEWSKRRILFESSASISFPSSLPFCWFLFLLLVVYGRADFKSYPKTIPTEIIYYRLSRATQLKQWHAAALHNFLYTFLARVASNDLCAFCFRAWCRVRFLRILGRDVFLLARAHTENKIQIDFL